jgi:UDP-N-acetylmuramate dehydrogenase
MRIQENFPLSGYLWYKIGGKASYFIEISSPDDIPPLVEFLEKEHPETVFLCGLGSNLVFKDEDFTGVVISIVAPAEKKPLAVTEDGQLTVFAGDTLDTVIQFGFEHNLIGLEWAGGLPGTVGAGVRGNVGAFGGEIKDSLVSAEVISLKEPEKQTQQLTNAALRFSYRHSLIKEKKELLVISATFALQKVTDAEVRAARETYEANRNYRKTNHPLEYPNCGSVFKNIKQKDQVEKVLSVWPELKEQVDGKWHGKVSMGYIVRKLGLAGFTVGNAQISEKHCNFIINLGGAKASEVRSIIKEIQDKCDETFGFRPEVEIEIVE